MCSMNGSTSAPSSATINACHQARNERHVAAQPIQLGDEDRALASSGIGQRGGKPRPAIKRVGALAGLDLGKFGGDGKALATGKLRVRRTSRLKAESGAALLLCGDADV